MVDGLGSDGWVRRGVSPRRTTRMLRRRQQSLPYEVVRAVGNAGHLVVAKHKRQRHRVELRVVDGDGRDVDFGISRWDGHDFVRDPAQHCLRVSGWTITDQIAHDDVAHH